MCLYRFEPPYLVETVPGLIFQPEMATGAWALSTHAGFAPLLPLASRVLKLSPIYTDGGEVE